MQDTGAKAGYIIGKSETTYQIEPYITVTNLQDFIKQVVAGL